MNEPEDLRRCLTALELQKAAGIPFEVVVVDNGSLSLPQEVCAEFDLVTLTQELIPGPGPARNHGANLARGKILAFIDADCVAEPEWLAAIVAFMDQHPYADVIAGEVGIICRDSRHTTAVEAYESVFGYRVRLYVERHHYAPTGNMAVRTRVFRAVGPFGGIRVMEDTDWGRRATAGGFRIAFAKGVKVHTPACKNFSELVRRWDRHIAHEFNNLAIGFLGKVKWVMLSLLVIASPAADMFTILRSEKISGPRERILAMVCLVRLRFYRGVRMLSLILNNDTYETVSAWNRDKNASASLR